MTDSPLLTTLEAAAVLRLSRRTLEDFRTMCGRLPVGKGYLDGDAELVGAAMCPACLCGTDRWPLAIMLSADQVPVINTRS